MNLFKRIFGRKELTQEEKDQQALDKRCCPDCGADKLMKGPTGGAGFNAACRSCYSEFVILDMFGNLKLMQRMGKLSPDRAEKVYGIPAPEIARKVLPIWSKYCEEANR